MAGRQSHADQISALRRQLAEVAGVVEIQAAALEGLTESMIETAGGHLRTLEAFERRLAAVERLDTVDMSDGRRRTISTMIRRQQANEPPPG